MRIVFTYRTYQNYLELAKKIGCFREYEEGKNKSMFASKDCTKEVFRNRGAFPKQEYPTVQHGVEDELHNAQRLTLIS